MRHNALLLGCLLALGALTSQPSAAYAGAAAGLSSAKREWLAWACLAGSGAFVVLTCYSRRRAERFCPWIFLQAALAVLAAVLAGGLRGSAWARLTHTMVYITSVSAALGALVHLSALQVQMRLRRTRSLSQALTRLEQLDKLLAHHTTNRSDRFYTVYQSEAAAIDHLKAPGLFELFKVPVEDAARADRIQAQMRYMSYSEQVTFETVTRLLLDREKLLVHISPYLKRNYLLERWCDLHVVLYAATFASVLLQRFVLIYY